MFVPNWLIGREIGLSENTVMAFFIIFIIVMTSVSNGYSNPIAGSSEDLDRGEKSLKIRSDEMILKSMEQKVFFKGNVIVRHHEMVLKADHVLLFLKEKESGSGPDFSFLDSQGEQQIEKIEAKGNVLFEGGIHRGESDRAEYFQAKRMVVLTGNPEVWEGESHLVGSKITILLDQKKSIVEESRVILHPQ